jgi:hypothetical protein
MHRTVNTILEVSVRVLLNEGKQKKILPGMVVHSCNASIQEAEAGELQV